MFSLCLPLLCKNNTFLLLPLSFGVKLLDEPQLLVQPLLAEVVELELLPQSPGQHLGGPDGEVLAGLAATRVVLLACEGEIRMGTEKLSLIGRSLSLPNGNLSTILCKIVFLK